MGPEEQRLRYPESLNFRCTPPIDDKSANNIKPNPFNNGFSVQKLEDGWVSFGMPLLCIFEMIEPGRFPSHEASKIFELQASAEEMFDSNIQLFDNLDLEGVLDRERKQPDNTDFLTPLGTLRKIINSLGYSSHESNPCSLIDNVLDVTFQYKIRFDDPASRKINTYEDRDSQPIPGAPPLCLLVPSAASYLLDNRINQNENDIFNGQTLYSGTRLEGVLRGIGTVDSYAIDLSNKLEGVVADVMYRFKDGTYVTPEEFLLKIK